MGVYEYSYSFSLDDEIIRRYSDCSEWYGYSVIEVRIKFTVKGSSISGGRVIIDSESFATGGADDPLPLQLCLSSRLKDCWMPDRQIGAMVRELILFAKQIRATGRRGKIPAAVDVEVCTVQREGEAMAAAEERALRPGILPPLYLYPMEGYGDPSRLNWSDFDIRHVESMPRMRVEDVEEASSVMDLCHICGRRPIVGTQIAMLECRHRFHYHCTVRRLLTESNSCPVCLHEPGFEFCPDLFPNPPPSRKTLETFWTRLLDDDDDDDDNYAALAPAPAPGHDSDLDDF